MKATEVMELLSDEERESLLEELIEASLLRYAGDRFTHAAAVGRRVIDSVDAAIGFAIEAQRDADELVREQDRDAAIERSVQVKAMRRAA